MLPSSPSLVHYAALRLRDEAGEWYGASVVTLHPETHHVISVQLFDGTERPFTQWLGGTIILSPLRELPLPPSPLTLTEWADLLPLSSAAHPDAPLYAWHLPATTPDAILPRWTGRL